MPAQTLRSYGAQPLVPPFPLQINHDNFRYAASPLNWEPVWMGRGSIFAQRHRGAPAARHPIPWAAVDIACLICLITRCLLL